MKNLIKLSLIFTFLILSCSKKVETESNIDVYHNCSHYCNNLTLKNNLCPKTNETVGVSVIGIVDASDIDDAIEIIESFYGWKCIVEYGKSITPDILYNGSNDVLDGEAIIQKYSSQNKIVYLIDKKLWGKGGYLRGIAAVNGGTVVVRGEKSFMRETIIHELGHTLGLRHCSDLTCIMAVDNDEFDSGTFCDKCSRQIGFIKK